MKQRTLPSGWKLEVLGKLSSAIQYGYTAKAHPEPVGPRMLRITDIQNDTVRWSEVPFCRIQKEEKQKYLLASNDIVFARTGATVGKSYLIRDPVPDSVFASYLIRVRLASAIVPKYVAYFFKSHDYWRQITESQAGIGQPNVNGTKLAQIEIPVAPVEHQQRIVAEIEKQFSRLDEAVSSLKRTKANLKRYKAAVLKAAVEGKLTEEWRKQHPNVEPASKLLERILAERRSKWNGKGKYKEPMPPDNSELPSLPRGWMWVSIEQLASLDVGFAFKSAEFAKAGIRLLRGENIGPGSLRWEDTRYWPETKLEDYKHLLIREGDIILAMDRPLISAGLKIARARVTDLPCLLVQRMARFLPVDDRMTPFIFISLNSNAFVRHLQGGQTGTQLPHISGSGIQSFLTPVPPIKEQEQIVAEVDRCLSVINELEATIEANLTRADRLGKSILTKAFTGQLLNT